MTARLLGPADAQLWRALWAEALAEMPAAFARRDAEASTLTPEVLKARRAAVLASVRAFVWETPDPVGCALWCRDADPARPRRGWVEAVFVRRFARGAGIAPRLLAALAEDARAHGIAELWLEVGRDNAAAHAAYARAGFLPAPDPAGRDSEIALRLSLSR